MTQLFIEGLMLGLGIGLGFVIVLYLAYRILEVTHEGQETS